MSENGNGGDLFHRIFDRCSDAIAISGYEDGRLVEVNQAFLRMTGFDREEVLGRSTLALGLWVDPREREEFLGAVAGGDGGTPVRFRLRMKSGEIRYIEASVQVTEFRGERCILAIDRDVTERIRAEQAKRETREMLQATLESTADGILVVDNQGSTAYANRRFAEMWRIPPDVLDTGSDDRLLTFVLDQLGEPDSFLAKVRELYETTVEDLDTLHFKDGRTFERYSRPLLHQGRLAGRVWSFRDVTERRRAEAALREAETKFRTLVEQIPAVVYIAPAMFEPWLYVSPQIEAMTGFAPEEWQADPGLWRRQVHPEDLERVLSEEARCFVTGERFGSEYRLARRDGRLIWVRDEATIIPGQGGEPDVLQGVMSDITERKGVEEKLEQAWHRELEAGHRLRALDDMKNTFLQAVSHELRTPLTSILGAALTLERGEETGISRRDAHELVVRLAANARKLNRLLTDLLDLDRLARGIVEPKLAPVDVGAMARLVVDESDALADHPVQVDAEPVTVSVDRAKVERIVENLLVNTARHTPPGTPVWVRVRGEAGGVLIAVEDAGPGVPEDLREDIFEPFRQAGPTRSPTAGVGVGLALVARFAELHGGRAWVEDGPEGGASFRVFLPELQPVGMGGPPTPDSDVTRN